jgi:hypothetical protein
VLLEPKPFDQIMLDQKVLEKNVRAKDVKICCGFSKICQQKSQ